MYSLKLWLKHKKTSFEKNNLVFKSRNRTTRATCYFMYTQLCEEKNPDPKLENADPPPNRNDPDPQD